MRYLYPILIFALASSCHSSTGKNEQAKADVETSQETKGNQEKGAFQPGIYHAYQLSAAGFGFQYKFELKEDGTYTLFDKIGEYSYDPSTNGIHFLTGSIKDYKGVFTRVNHVNDTRKLMIVLDFHENATTPDTLALDKKPGGYFQYAYFQGE